MFKNYLTSVGNLNNTCMLYTVLWLKHKHIVYHIISQNKRFNISSKSLFYYYCYKKF